MNSLIGRRYSSVSSHLIRNNHRLSPINTNSKTLNRIQCLEVNRIQSRNNSSQVMNLLLFSQIAPIVGLIVGRIIQRQFPHLMSVNIRSVLRRNKYLIGAAMGLTAGLSAAVYEDHTEETPMTGRKRFIIFRKKDYEPISDMMFKIIFKTYKHRILPPEHRTTRRVHNIVKRVLLSNTDLKEVLDKNWSVYVIKDTQMANAFVLPTGQIFVYTGIIGICDNDDQLATIVAHELSHTLLTHGKEVLTREFIVDMVQAMTTMFIWIRMRTLPALITTVIAGLGIKGLFLLPKRRLIEREADVVGLMLAAKACYDVREGSAFWMKMAALEDPNMKTHFSTHPSNTSRYELMDSYMDRMIKLMECHNCPKLSQKDPRDLVRKRYAEGDRNIRIKIE